MRVLVDTSVWVEFFRNGDSKLDKLLAEGLVVTHPMVIGELACGNIKSREKIFSLLNDISKCEVVEDGKVVSFIEKYKLYGKGLGFIDFHLLTSSIMSSVELYTFDKKLKTLKTKINKIIK